MEEINSAKIRSLLFVPSIKTHFFGKLFNLKGADKPDGIIFDLEDSVSEKCKGEARDNLRKFLYQDNDYRSKLFREYVIFIRINDFRTDWFQPHGWLIL